MSVLALGLMVGASGMARGADEVTTAPNAVMAGAEDKPADPVSKELEGGGRDVGRHDHYFCVFVYCVEADGVEADHDGVEGA